MPQSIGIDPQRGGCAEKVPPVLLKETGDQHLQTLALFKSESSELVM